MALWRIGDALDVLLKSLLLPPLDYNCCCLLASGTPIQSS